jgi:branched-chain amino acid transport system substrate-binding protein
MSDLVRQRPGGSIVAQRYVPLNAGPKDFESIVSEIKELRPDFIFSTVVGNATQHFYRAYAESGLDPKSMPVASLTTSEVEISQMGSAVAAGHFTAAPYFASIDSAENHRVLNRFHARFGDEIRPNACWEAAYFQVYLFANAMRSAGTDSVPVLMPQILASEFLAPQGRVRVEPNNHHTHLYPRIGRVNSKGEFAIVRASKNAVVPDPYLVTHSLGDWTLALETLKD